MMTEIRQGGAIPNDLTAFWMPFTANRDFKTAPRFLVGAKGMYYQSHDQRQILDAVAGLWCVNAGHGRQEITEAVTKQLEQLDFAPSFQMGHPLAFELASRLTDLAPRPLDHVFFTNSGSEAVDTALKIALAYHRARGEGGRIRFIGRGRAYHGVGFGGISVGGLVNNRKAFGLGLPGVDHLADTHDLARNAFSAGQPEFGAERADELERLIALHDASNIAAVIVEPIAGSTGVLLPPKDYLQRLRKITARHGILLIFDEVITGFGRLGTGFAAEYFSVIPDIITLAKGVTNGSIPMGAVIASAAIHDAFMQGPGTGIELFHGYTYSGHPVACAAALATLNIYRDDALFQRVTGLTAFWQEQLHNLRGSNHIIDIRALGLLGAIELEPRPSAPGARGFETFLRCYEAGVLIRAAGDTLAFSPPLIIERHEIERLVATLGKVLHNID